MPEQRSQDRSSERNGVTTLASEAYDRIRSDILSGYFSAGSPLRLEALRSRYGFSFSPVREALNRLRSERLVELSALRGFRVAGISRSEMWDAISTRILIDAEGLRLSILHGDDNWEASVVGTFHALSRNTDRLAAADGVSSDDAQELENRHRDFHFALISASGSLWLSEFSAQLYSQTERYRRPSIQHDADETAMKRDIVSEHKAIMEAAIARNAPLAAKLVREHYRLTGEMIEGRLLLAERVSASASTKRARTSKVVDATKMQKPASTGRKAQPANAD